MNQEKNNQLNGNVKVVCRFRPFNEKEKIMGLNSIHQILQNKTVIIKENRNEKIENLPFNFDRAFDINSTQEQIYTYAAKPVVDSVLEGFNGTIFAYGQTSSGKTYTMQGATIQNDIQAGIIPRMIKHVFDSISNSPDSLQFRMKVSIVELYMEKLRDLLNVNKNDLKIRSDKKKGIYIEDLTENYISEPEEVFEMIRIAQLNRAISATNMNERSSRSHMLFIITINQNNLQDLSAKTGKLYLVDLAGSQKVGKTGAEGKLLDQAKKINTSLATLGKVINALTDGKSTHVPYRDSKLTRVLQQSLGGNSKTTLIVTCSPHIYNLAESLSTLRFGVSAKNIKNKPKINREMTVAQLQLLLQKAEARVIQKQKTVQKLQQYIKNDLKAKLPFSDDETEQGIELLQQVEDQRIKTLQSQLQIERNNVMLQSQKITGLKKQINQLKMRNQSLEKQNEALLDRVVTAQNTTTSQIHTNDSNSQLIALIYSKTTDSNIKKLIQQKGLVSKQNQIQNNADIILQQIQQNYEMERQKRRKCQQQIQRNEKDLKKKITSLQNNLQQLTSVYYDLFVEQGKWKIQNSLNLKKLQKKNKIIVSLENTITDLKEELNRRKQQQEFSDSDDSYEQNQQVAKKREIKALKQFAHSKLVKPVRGGKTKS